MADLPPRRILLSEGASTSAREAVTALGLSGHVIDICDPDPHCLARFSRFVRRVHRCPPAGRDPFGYLDFMNQLLAADNYDVLVPIHEQGLLFARQADRFSGRAGLALPTFQSYLTVLDKGRFSRLLGALELAQPATRFAESYTELQALARAPCAIKLAIGTASRGVWLVRNERELADALRELSMAAHDGSYLVQDLMAAPIEHAQGVFSHGALVGFHAFRPLRRGAGGGAAVKESVARPRVRADVARIGAALDWHGALSVDYFLPDSEAPPLFIDGNPRLVEPMSARLAGLDLAELLVRVSLGQQPAAAPESRPGVRTHLGLQALFGAALGAGTRRAVLAECRELLFGRGIYKASVEELTPLRDDWMSVIPLAATAVLLGVNPGLAKTLPRRGWGQQLLTVDTIQRIEAPRS